MPAPPPRDTATTDSPLGVCGTKLLNPANCQKGKNSKGEVEYRFYFIDTKNCALKYAMQKWKIQARAGHVGKWHNNSR